MSDKYNINLIFYKFLKRVILWWYKLSFVGIFIGAIFIALSLTPSLLPRQPLIQGLLSGIVFVVGYWIGKLWRYLELPKFKKHYNIYLQVLCGIVVGISITYSSVHWGMWQNSILSAMGQENLIVSHSIFVVVFVSFLTAGCLILIGNILYLSFYFVRKQIYKVIPRRISNFIGFVIAIFILIITINGVLIKNIFKVLDSSAAKVNELTEDGIKKPTDINKTGSDKSLIAWNTLGREGKNFIAKGPTADDISKFKGSRAMEPLRVYVGLKSANSVQERARLALEELKRIDAFSRKIMVISTPTGTGWLDPNAVDTLEYIYSGDTVNVGIQYSYLSSQSTLLFLPTRANETSEVMFHTIYNYWKKMPKNKRPKLYLFGLSLGSFGSEHSAKLYEMIDDPINGALWVGPPFVNKLHRDIMTNRNMDSPAWLPIYDDSSLVRFTLDGSNLNSYKSNWGKLRLIYM